MSLRRHVITGEPVLFAPARAARPHAVSGDVSAERCPFCPGHEEDTPPELVRLGDADRWTARVFPNKYPAADGAEVIVESPDHHARFDSIEDAEGVVRLYVDRYRAHAGAAYTALFKNEGTAAGSSIAHIHSQVVPVPFVPPRIAKELEGFAQSCPLCKRVDEALLIRETESFLWFAPWGSFLAYQQWLVPKRHVAEMSAFQDRELVELASLLREVARATGAVSAAYNWAFMNFPRDANGHAYVDILPRMAAIAGFELGTGTFVEIVDPAAAAARLRQ